jgi:hypothetical protein
MKISVSYGFGEENRYNQSTIPKNIQLAIWKSEEFWDHKQYIEQQLKENKTSVNVVHLPLDTLKQNAYQIFKMIDFFTSEFKCKKYIIHPNKKIKEFIAFYQTTPRTSVLCIETFQWRKKKQLRTPLEIIDYMGWINHPYEDPIVKMTIDTSHIEEVWFDHKIMPYLLKYTSVIHLSNRIGRKSHLPFNVSGGDLNLVGFVLDLKNKYHWDGDIVLEYMPEYRSKLYKNCIYVNRLLGEIS